MKVVIENLYGLKDGHKAYYRKQGLCFDFTWDKNDASELTNEEAMKIIKDGEYYKKQYNASEIYAE